MPDKKKKLAEIQEQKKELYKLQSNLNSQGRVVGGKYDNWSSYDIGEELKRLRFAERHLK